MKRAWMMVAMLALLMTTPAQAGFLPSPCIGCGDWQVVGPHGWEGPPPARMQDLGFLGALREWVESIFQIPYPQNDPPAWVRQAR